MAHHGKIIIISAPSGCGKSTIINKLMAEYNLPLKFSVSATNRSPREGEIDGVHYHFLTDEAFRQAIADNQFVEYEEVYPGRFYGTLKSEVEKTIAGGGNVLLDIDVKGGCRVKEMYPADAISIFIAPPSIPALRQRLEGRGTDSSDAIETRLSKAAYELTFAARYDARVINDNLDIAAQQVYTLINDFIAQ